MFFLQAVCLSTISVNKYVRLNYLIIFQGINLILFFPNFEQPYFSGQGTS